MTRQQALHRLWQLKEEQTMLWPDTLAEVQALAAYYQIPATLRRISLDWKDDNRKPVLIDLHTGVIQDQSTAL